MPDVYLANEGTARPDVATSARAQQVAALRDLAARMRDEMADAGFAGGTALSNAVAQRLSEIGTTEAFDDVDALIAELDSSSSFGASGRRSELAEVEATFLEADAILAALAGG